MCVVVLSAAVLPLHRVRNDDVLDSLPVIALPAEVAAGLASLFPLRNGLRGSQSRMA